MNKLEILLALLLLLSCGTILFLYSQVKYFNNSLIQSEKYSNDKDFMIESLKGANSKLSNKIAGITRMSMNVVKTEHKTLKVHAQKTINKDFINMFPKDVNKVVREEVAHKIVEHLLANNCIEFNQDENREKNSTTHTGTIRVVVP